MSMIAASKLASTLSGLARDRHAVFVGEHDRVDAVAQAETGA